MNSTKQISQYDYISEPDNEANMINDIDSGINSSNVGSRYKDEYIPKGTKTFQTEINNSRTSLKGKKRKKMSKTFSLANVKKPLRRRNELKKVISGMIQTNPGKLKIRNLKFRNASKRRKKKFGGSGERKITKKEINESRTSLNPHYGLKGRRREIKEKLKGMMNEKPRYNGSKTYMCIKKPDLNLEKKKMNKTDHYDRTKYKDYFQELIMENRKKAEEKDLKIQEKYAHLVKKCGERCSELGRRKMSKNRFFSRGRHSREKSKKKFELLERKMQFKKLHERAKKMVRENSLFKQESRGGINRKGRLEKTRRNISKKSIEDFRYTRRKNKMMSPGVSGEN